MRFRSQAASFSVLYFLTLVACVISGFDHQTGVHLLDLIIGAILRDMQDNRAGVHTNGQ